jgi:hypothetical protein
VGLQEGQRVCGSIIVNTIPPDSFPCRYNGIRQLIYHFQDFFSINEERNNAVKQMLKDVFKVIILRLIIFFVL